MELLCSNSVEPEDHLNLFNVYGDTLPMVTSFHQTGAPTLTERDRPELQTGTNTSYM